MFKYLGAALQIVPIAQRAQLHTSSALLRGGDQPLKRRPAAAPARSIQPFGSNATIETRQVTVGIRTHLDQTITHTDGILRTTKPEGASNVIFTFTPTGGESREISHTKAVLLRDSWLKS